MTQEFKAPQKIEGGIIKAFTFAGKLVAFAIPVMIGIYMTRFVDRKIIKGKVKDIAE